MTAIIKTLVVALALYAGIYIACPKQAKQAVASVTATVYGQLANVGR